MARDDRAECRQCNPERRVDGARMFAGDIAVDRIDLTRKVQAGNAFSRHR
jgi:hypothetical protein